MVLDMDYKKKNILLSVIVIVLGLSVVGGTYAFLTYAIDVTNGSYAYNTACFDIEYDITNKDGTSDITGTLIPSSTVKRGLSGNVSLGIKSGCNVYGVGNIYLNITNSNSTLTKAVNAHCENITTLETMFEYTTEGDCTSQTNGIWVTDGTALKYAVYKESKDEPISVGYINSSSQVIDIYKEFNVEEQIDYNIYIWLDGNLIDNSYTSLSFGGNISARVTQVELPLPEKPDLDQNGMIPVIISENGTVTTIDKDDDNWYDYLNKEWANAILVTDISRGKYRGTSGVTVSESDILAYYVWVPRYKYELWTTTVSSAGNEQTINIKFENSETSMSVGTSIGSYRTHPAFWWDDDSDGVVDDGETIAGIWVGKFETSSNKESTCYTSNSTSNCLPANVSPRIVPNVKSLRYQTVSNQFATSQKFSASGNAYGLNHTNTNAHMMKNSEWGSVAYLSHSAYGINGEIYINNSSNYFTGRSGGGVGSDDLSTTSYGNYTWLGQSVGTDNSIGSYETNRTLGTYASTTGNVTGVYDMSGGAWEYVMGVLADSSGKPRSGKSTELNSGFNGTVYNEGADETYTVGMNFPNTKYYDLYMNRYLLTVYGLYEINNWYGDYATFIGSEYPWSERGGRYSNGSLAGIFAFEVGDGAISNYRSWRSVLVVGYGE